MPKLPKLAEQFAKTNTNADSDTTLFAHNPLGLPGDEEYIFNYLNYLRNEQIILKNPQTLSQLDLQAAKFSNMHRLVKALSNTRNYSIITEIDFSHANFNAQSDEDIMRFFKAIVDNQNLTKVNLSNVDFQIPLNLKTWSKTLLNRIVNALDTKILVDANVKTLLFNESNQSKPSNSQNNIFQAAKPSEKNDFKLPILHVKRINR